MDQWENNLAEWANYQIIPPKWAYNRLGHNLTNSTESSN